MGSRDHQAMRATNSLKGVNKMKSTFAGAMGEAERFINTQSKVAEQINTKLKDLVKNTDKQIKPSDKVNK